MICNNKNEKKKKKTKESQTGYRSHNLNENNTVYLLKVIMIGLNWLNQFYLKTHAQMTLNLKTDLEEKKNCQKMRIYVCFFCQKCLIFFVFKF